MINNTNYVTFADSTESVLEFKEFTENTKDPKFHASKKEWCDKHATINNQQITFEQECKLKRPKLRETENYEEKYGCVPMRQTHIIKFEPFQVFVEEKGMIRFNFIMRPGYNYDLLVEKIRTRIGYKPSDYYLKMAGVVLSEHHYFKCTGAPIWITICIKGLGGSKRLVVNRKCQECGRVGNCHTFQKCPQAAALDKEESSKGKSELSNSNSNLSNSMDDKSRSYFRKLLIDEALGRLKEEKEDILASMKACHPDQFQILADELLEEEIHVSKEKSNYDTERLKNKRAKGSKTTNFESKAKATFVNSPSSVKDLVDKYAVNKNPPESKLRCSSVKSNPVQEPTIPELDPFELIEFEYEVPEDFLFFKLEANKQILSGKLPRFAIQYLNTTSSLPSSAINIRNSMLLLFKEEVTKKYVENMTNKQLNTFQKMVIAYYSTVQYDQFIRPNSKILNWIGSLRKKNVEDLKDDSPYGYNVKNIIGVAKMAVEHQLTVWGKKLFHTVKESEYTKKVVSFVKKAEGKVFIDDDEDSSDDDDDFPAPILQVWEQVDETTDGQIDSYAEVYHTNDAALETWSDVLLDSEVSLDTEKLNFAIDYLEKRSATVETLSPETVTYTTVSYESPQTKSEPVNNKATRKMSNKKEKKKLMKENREKQKLGNILDASVVLQDCLEFKKKYFSNEVESLDAKGDEPKDDGQMTIISSFPRASVIIEEVVKQILPLGIGATIIGKIDDYVHGSKHRLNWHKKSMKYGFTDRLKMHHEYNKLAVNDLVNHYEHYSTRADIMPPCIVPDLTNLGDGQFLSSVPLPIINPELVEFYPYPHVGNPAGALERKQELIKFYPLLFAINNFVSYGNTNENFVAAVLCRLLYPKTNGPVAGEWKKIIDEIQIFDFNFIPDFEAWFRELNPRQKAEVQRHLEAMERGDKIDTSTGVFLKMKELLKKSSKGYGRLIFNVSTKYLLLLGDFLTQFSSAMVASLFPPIPTYTISKIACFHYASKFSDVAMNQFVNIAMMSPCGKFVLVLGDDTMIIDRDLAKYTEVDFSAYDSTQVIGGGLDLFPALLEKMGCVEQAQEYRNMYAEKIKWRHNASGTKLEMPDTWKTSPSRMSGEPGTSVANSYTTIMATKAVLEGTSSYAKLGLVAKEKHSNELDTTFLKGIFLYSVKADKWYWTRLPGFILKLKSFTEPVKVYKDKYPIQKAQQQLLWSQWLGFGNTNTNWFYTKLGKFIKSLCPLASNVELKEDYKVYTEDSFYIEDIEFDSMMWNRYGISREESEDYLSFLNDNATALPIIYQHTLTDKLFEVDA